MGFDGVFGFALEMQEGQLWNAAKKAAAAAAISFALCASPVQAKEDSVLPKFPDNSAGAAVSHPALYIMYKSSYIMHNAHQMCFECPIIYS